jgi:hypothetical protein
MAGKEEIKRLEQEIKRANTRKALDEARDEYIRLLEVDDWEVTRRAFTEGIPILRAIGVEHPTQCALVDKVLQLLKSGHPIKAIGMGEPQGVNGIAHVMNDGYLEGLYIKIKLEDKKVIVLSFHQ